MKRYMYKYYPKKNELVGMELEVDDSKYVPQILTGKADHDPLDSEPYYYSISLSKPQALYNLRTYLKRKQEELTTGLATVEATLKAKPDPAQLAIAEEQASIDWDSYHPYCCGSYDD